MSQYRVDFSSGSHTDSAEFECASDAAARRARELLIDWLVRVLNPQVGETIQGEYRVYELTGGTCVCVGALSQRHGAAFPF